MKLSNDINSFRCGARAFYRCAVFLSKLRTAWCCSRLAKTLLLAMTMVIRIGVSEELRSVYKLTRDRMMNDDRRSVWVHAFGCVCVGARAYACAYICRRTCMSVSAWSLVLLRSGILFQPSLGVRMPPSICVRQPVVRRMRARAADGVSEPVSPESSLRGRHPHTHTHVVTAAKQLVFTCQYRVLQ